MDQNKKFWEKTAAFYAVFMKRNGLAYDNISDKIIERLNKDMKVLELACGSGQMTFRLADYVKKWDATDFSPAMIAEAKKRNTFKNVCFSVQDATALPYDDDSYDAVVIANALHIMPRPDQALAEIFRVLKAGGLLFAPTFIWKNHAAFDMRAWLLMKLGLTVFHKWSQIGFVHFVEKKGFLVREYAVVGSEIAPICYLVARKPF
ncbi:MAG: class I SAM-dependent methyltransferase [Anaerotignum sp.]|nr:class I SAM-dependent methyltransferase [Anaerotignum sp.]